MNPQLTITIDRAGLSLPPLVFSGHDTSVPLAITEPVGIPGRIARVAYMPDSADVHGSEPISSSWQQGLISFPWFLDGAEDEAALMTARREVEAAIGQFEFTVITQEGNAPAEVWSAHTGSMERPERDYVNLANRNPVFPVTIPVYPIPEAS